MNAKMLRLSALAALALSLILLATIGITAYRDLKEFHAADAAAQGTQHAAQLFRDVLAHLADAESSHRVYLKSGRDSDRQRCLDAVTLAEKTSTEWQANQRRSGQASEATRRLPELVQQKAEELRLGMATHQPSGAVVPDRGSRKVDAELAALVAAAAVEPPEQSGARLSALAQEEWMVTLIGCLALFLLVGGSLAAIVVVFGQQDRLGQILTRAARDAGEQRGLWQATLSSIGDAVLVTDTKGRLLSGNAVAQQLTGWTGEALLKADVKEVLNFIDAETGQTAGNPFPRVLESGETAVLENVDLTRRNRSVIPVEGHCAPVRDRAGKLLGAVAVLRDTTERRQAQAAAQEKVRWCRSMLDAAAARLAKLSATSPDS